MGLFEKQIPKYVRTPEEEVVVEPVVVDDIFDPLFNAEVKARLAQDYGNSPFATFAGYNELLNNIWTENDGTFGKGMGLLSAFGRSMEKADDLILGAATETIEGISGQGFDNPIENIFVNDEDYTGRRFLAAAANTMRGFADGVTVTEEDFNGAWGLPSLGIELMSDVGILGGGLARGLAPELTEQAGKRVPSSEILRNLGKSGNATTTIGEVGQLLSDYDDLMTRAAIDITAPGLRPAFKALLPKIKQFMGYTDAEDFVDVYMNRPRVDVNGAEVPPPDGAFELYKNAYAKMMEIPETPEEELARMSRTVDEIADDALANAEENAFNEMVEEIIEEEAARAPRKVKMRIRDILNLRDLSDASKELLKKKYSDTDTFVDGLDTVIEIDNPRVKYATHVPKKSPRLSRRVRKAIREHMGGGGTSVDRSANAYGAMISRSIFGDDSPVKFPAIMRTSTRDMSTRIADRGPGSLYALEKERFTEWNKSKLNQWIQYNQVLSWYKEQMKRGSETMERHTKLAEVGQWLKENRPERWTETEMLLAMDEFEDTWSAGRIPTSVVRDLKARIPEAPASSEKTIVDALGERYNSAFKKAQKSIEEFTANEGAAIETVLKRAREKGRPIEHLGTDTRPDDTIRSRFIRILNDTDSRKVSFRYDTPEVSRGSIPQDAITSFRGDHDFLSNMYETPVTFGGRTYRNAEAAFQAQKCPARADEFVNLSGPEAKKLGRKVKLREDWESVKQGIMELVVKKKFEQSPELMQRLKETGTKPLIELNDWGDDFWGVSSGKGANRLGYILEDVRNAPDQYTRVNDFLDDVRETLTDALEVELELHPTYLPDVVEAMSTNAKLGEALRTGVWSVNETVSKTINAYLSSPKHRDKLFYRMSSPKWFVSPSERALISRDDVSDAIGEAYSSIKASLYEFEDNFSTPSGQFGEDFLEIPQMQAVLRDVLGYKPPSQGAYDAVTGQMTVAPLAGAFDTSETPNISAKVRKLKKLVSDFYSFETESDISKLTLDNAYKKLYNLVEFFDKNVDFSKISDEVLQKFPEEVYILERFANAIDNVGTQLIAPIKGLGVAPRDVRYSYYFPKKGTGFEDDFAPNFNMALKNIVAQLGQQDIPYEDLKYILEPLRDYVQFGFKHGEMDFTGTAPERIVNRFFKEVLPLAEEALSAGILPKKGFLFYDTAKGFTSKKALRLASLLGIKYFDAKPDPDAEHFADLLKLVGIDFDAAFAPLQNSFKGLPEGATQAQVLEHLLSSKDPDVKKWGFRPERDVPTPMHRVEEFTEPPANMWAPPVYEQEIDPDSLTDEGIKALNMYIAQYGGDAVKAAEAFQSTMQGVDHKAITKYIQGGFKGPPPQPTPHYEWVKPRLVEEVDEKGRVVYREKRYPLTRDSRLASEGYWHRPALGDSHRRTDLGPIPLNELPFLRPMTPADFKAKSDEFLRHVVAQEREVLFRNPEYRGDAAKEYDALFKRLQHLQRLYKFSDDELSTLLSKTTDLKAFRALPIETKRFLYAYTSEYVKGIQNLPYHAIDLRSLDFQNPILRRLEAEQAELGDLPYEWESYLTESDLAEFDAHRNLIFEMIDSTGSKRADDLKRLYDNQFRERKSIMRQLAYIDENYVKRFHEFKRKRLDELKGVPYVVSEEAVEKELRDAIDAMRQPYLEKLKAFQSTPELEKFVRDELISKLGPDYKKFAKYYSPGETSFDFNVPSTGDVEYVRIGENLPMHPDYLQIWERHGMGFNQALEASRKSPMFRPSKEGPREVGNLMAGLDYSKLYLPDLYGNSARQSLMEIVAKRQLQMKYFSTTSWYSDPIGVENDVTADIRKLQYEMFARTPKDPSEVAERVVDIIEDQPVEELVTQFVEPATTSLIEAAQRNLVDEICPTISKLLSEGVPIDLVKKSLKKHDEWRWFEQIAQASTVRSRNATGDYATLREKRAEDIARRFVELEETLPYAESRKYYILKEKEMGDILTGSDFWNEFISTGMFAASFPKGSEHIENLRKAMQHNADTINTALKGDYVEVVVHNIKAREPNSVCVTMRWKPGKHDLIKRVVNNKQALDSAKFVDLVFSPPETLTSYEKEFLNKPTIKKLIDLEHEALSLIREHYARLGFTFDPAKEYTRHALNRRDDQGALQFFLKENFYGQISSETLDDISDNLATVYNTRRAFGSRAVGRRFRGRYWDTERQVLPLFSYSPLGRFKSAIASGALANSQYQAFTDFFVNDNFKIKGIFNSVDDLKKVLYATDEKGRLGNFTNAELVTFKVDATGRVIGLTKFDKTTDKGLQSALNDPNAILVPASVITSLDKMFRREAQMSNKFWVFINKYLTLPFKLGVLTNPGFLLGNISDATMKMATTMSRKYGTTFQQEAENTAKSISEVIALKNSYYDAFDEFLAAVAEVDAKLDPKQRIPDIVAMDPKSQKTFLKWLNDGYEVKNALGIVETVPCYLTSQQREAACFWLTLQTLQMNSSKLREFEEVAGAAHVSPYAMPTNPVERFIEGSGKYDPKNFRTWGFFMNNPIASGMLNASEGIEDVVRTASIVDDLRHKRYDAKRVSDILSKGSDEQITQLLVDIEGARNAMYSSQFDYERLTDFLDGVGTVVPFPIFFLKNFAYWMELFMENPQFVDNVVDVQEGLWAHRQEEDENDEFAKAAKGRGAIPIGGDLTGWFKGIYKPSPLQSMFGAFSLLNDPMSDLTYRVHPAISGVVAKAHEQMPTDLTTLLGGSDERSYRPYSTDIYEKNVKESDPNFDPMQYTMHRANPYERATQTYLRTPAKIANGEAQLSDFLPSIFQPDY